MLLKQVGLVQPEGTSTVNIVPLFETIEDLRNCVTIMDRLLSIPQYRALVDSLGGTQVTGVKSYDWDVNATGR